MPHPLHPAIVHFPLVLAVSIPFVAGAALLFIARGTKPRVAWPFVLIVAAGLSVSAWVAVETGEDQSEAVEAVVPETVIEGHQEAAEALLVASLVLLALTAIGLAPKRIGQVARVVSAPAAIVLLVMAFRVGESGGRLVYTHGAASAYTNAGPGGVDAPRAPSGEDDEDRDTHR